MDWTHWDRGLRDLLAKGGRGKEALFCQVQRRGGPGARNTGDLEEKQYSCQTGERGQGRYVFTISGHGHLYLKSEDLLLSAPRLHPFPVGHSENEDIFTSNEFQAPAENIGEIRSLTTGFPNGFSVKA